MTVHIIAMMLLIAYALYNPHAYYLIWFDEFYNERKFKFISLVEYLIVVTPVYYFTVNIDVYLLIIIDVLMLLLLAFTRDLFTFIRDLRFFLIFKIVSLLICAIW